MSSCRLESREEEATTSAAVERPEAVSPVSPTITISEAAALLGVGRNLAYQVVSRDGELAGVPVIRVGRRLLIPHARLLAVLGLEDHLPVAEHGA